MEQGASMGMHLYYTSRRFIGLKKVYVLTVFLISCCLSLTACSLNSSQSSNENNSQDSANTEDVQETDELSIRLKQYESFLKDEISSENGSEGALYLRDFCNRVVPEEAEDEIRYALFDMTGDELPELHVLTDISYSIHTIEDNQLITWYLGDRYNRPLNNRAILQTIESTGITYSYIVLDSKGQKVLDIGFHDPRGQRGKNYLFSTDYDYVELSKSEWDKLTKPFLSIGSDKIVWKNINDLDF